jgi:hypothetical protein
MAHPGTKDLDLAGPQAVPPGERPPIRELLEAHGLQSRGVGDIVPPLVKFSPIGETSTVELELLVPLIGQDAERAVAMQEGLHVQPLRYLDLLLFEPWEIPVDRIPIQLDLPDCAVLRVPNPTSYIMQKILIRRREGRRYSGLRKDCYYIYEIAVMFRDVLPGLAAIAGRLERGEGIGPVGKSWTRRFRADLGRLFADPGAEGPVSAASVHRDARKGRPDLPEINEEMIHMAVAKLIGALGGPTD